MCWNVVPALQKCDRTMSQTSQMWWKRVQAPPKMWRNLSQTWLQCWIIELQNNWCVGMVTSGAGWCSCRTCLASVSGHCHWWGSAGMCTPGTQQTTFYYNTADDILQQWYQYNNRHQSNIVIKRLFSSYFLYRHDI